MNTGNSRIINNLCVFYIEMFIITLRTIMNEHDILGKLFMVGRDNCQGWEKKTLLIRNMKWLGFPASVLWARSPESWLVHMTLSPHLTSQLSRRSQSSVSQVKVEGLALREAELPSVNRLQILPCYPPHWSGGWIVEWPCCTIKHSH